jgi:PAS domain-containing protein
MPQKENVAYTIITAEDFSPYVMKDKLYRLSAAVRNALLQEQGVRARKAAERALLESEANMRALIEHSPVAMIVDTGLGESEKVTMLNQRFTQLFGYTLEDIPDVSHWWPLAYPDKDYREKLQTEFNILAH